VVVSVSELVFAATVEDDVTTLTAGELGGSTAFTLLQNEQCGSGERDMIESCLSPSGSEGSMSCYY